MRRLVGIFERGRYAIAGDVRMHIQQLSNRRTGRQLAQDMLDRMGSDSDPPMMCAYQAELVEASRQIRTETTDRLYSNHSPVPRDAVQVL